MKMKRVIAWGLGVAVIVAAGLYGELIRRMSNHEPDFLLAIVDVEKPWLAWTCKQILLHDSFSKEQVARLNSDAGASYPVYMNDTATAEQMLALFIAKGVNINAGDERTRGWTALHGMAIEGNVERAKLLIKYGASAGIRDKNGMTPLDFAIRMQKKYPLEPKRAEMVLLLEDAKKR